MAGHKPWSGLKKRFTAEQRARIDDSVRRMERRMLLSELRRAADKSQTQLAADLRVSQPALSKIEKQGDMHIATLRRFVEACGGTLELVARLPDGPVKVKLPRSTGIKRRAVARKRPARGRRG